MWALRFDNLAGLDTVAFDATKNTVELSSGERSWRYCEYRLTITSVLGGFVLRGRLLADDGELAFTVRGTVE